MVVCVPIQQLIKKRSVLGFCDHWPLGLGEEIRHAAAICALKSEGEDAGGVALDWPAASHGEEYAQPVKLPETR